MTVIWLRWRAAEPDANARGYRDGLPHWTAEFGRLGSGLAAAEGDLRFYLSPHIRWSDASTWRENGLGQPATPTLPWP